MEVSLKDSQAVNRPPLSQDHPQPCVSELLNAQCAAIVASITSVDSPEDIFSQDIQESPAIAGLLREISVSIAEQSTGGLERESELDNYRFVFVTDLDAANHQVVPTFLHSRRLKLALSFSKHGHF